MLFVLQFYMHSKRIEICTVLTTKKVFSCFLHMHVYPPSSVKTSVCAHHHAGVILAANGGVGDDHCLHAR